MPLKAATAPDGEAAAAQDAEREFADAGPASPGRGSLNSGATAHG